MNDTNETWVTDFAATPAIAHAVKVLRQAIPHDSLPTGTVGISISYADGVLEHGSATLAFTDTGKYEFVIIPLTEQQQTAAYMLVSVAAYHHEQMCAMFGEVDDSGKMPKELAVAQKQLRDDIRHKLNIDLSGFFLNGLDGSVKIYL